MRYASGASAIAVPGWPAFACCTASIDSVLIVSIESCWTFVAVVAIPTPAAALAPPTGCPCVSGSSSRHRLVEVALSPTRQTIRICPLLPRLEHASERRRRRRLAQALEREHRGAAQRALLDGRRRHRPLQHVCHDLRPVRVDEERVAGGDDLAHAWHQVEDLRESGGDALERRLEQVVRRRLEREARDRAAGARVP